MDRVAAELSREELQRWPRVRLTTYQKKIVQKFQLGLKTVCGLKIWDRLMTIITGDEGRELNEYELESRFRIGRTTFNKGRNSGAISLESVTLLLTDLDRDFDEISMPERHERLLEAYREAMCFVANTSQIRTDVDPRTIKLDELLGTNAALTVLLDEEWISRRTDSPLTADDWSEIASEAASISSRWWNKASRPADGPDAKRLVETWGAMLTPCLEAMPSRWMEWGDRS